MCEYVNVMERDYFSCTYNTDEGKVRCGCIHVQYSSPQLLVSVGARQSNRNMLMSVAKSFDKRDSVGGEECHGLVVMLQWTHHLHS